MSEEGKEVAAWQVPPLYKDGSVLRGKALPPPLIPSAEPGQEGVAFRDVTFHVEHGLCARLFLLNPHLYQPHTKIPLVLFFPGGRGGAHESHHICAEMAKRSGFLWVSASYRLSPENRLPAAFHDAFSALEWIQYQAFFQDAGKEELMDPWLSRADFSRCFLVGESTGAYIIHHVAMRTLNKLSPSSETWEPLCICGLIHLFPRFLRDAKARTQEERDIPPDMLLNWELEDAYIDLAMPVGDEKENHHPFYNPIPELTSAGKVDFPKVLVTLAENDCLHVMGGREFVRALKGAGCNVDVLMSQGVGHCFYFMQPYSEQANIFFERLNSFINED